MNLLLDTHAWLWFVLGDAQLSTPAKEHIEDPANLKFVSPASYWEVSIKISLGKYVLAGPYQAFMHRAIAANGFRILHVLPAHTEEVSKLPFHHRDPFDRLLIAQAAVERMTLVSGDGAFTSYGIPVIW